VQNVDDAFDVFHSVAMVNPYLSVLAVSHKIRQFFSGDLPTIRVNCVVDGCALNEQDFAVRASLESDGHIVV
jgi:hypothetical protein